MNATCPTCGCSCRAERVLEPADLTTLVIEPEKHLTPTGYTLLAFLAPGRVQRSYDEVWDAIRPGIESGRDLRRHLMLVHVHRLNRVLVPLGLRVLVTPRVGLELITCEPRPVPAVQKRTTTWHAIPFRNPAQRAEFLEMLRDGRSLLDTSNTLSVTRGMVRRARERWPEWDAEIRAALAGRVVPAAEAVRRDVRETRVQARPEPRPVAVALSRSERRMAASVCKMNGCGRRLEEHSRCIGCGFVMGGVHILQPAGDGRCGDCAQARPAVVRPHPVAREQAAYL